MSESNFEAVVMGASAGAVEALNELLPTLPKDFTLPIIIVVHLPPDKNSVMADLFQQKCNLKVKEAEDKEPIEDGTIYFAPPDYHLLIEKEKYFSLSNDEPLLFSRPSINVLFESAADVYDKKVIGVILTGANNDGADGLKTIVDAGGVALIQKPKFAYASAMPEAAMKACPQAEILDLKQISEYLQKA